MYIKQSKTLVFCVGEDEIIVSSFHTSLKVCMFIVCIMHSCLYVSSLVKFIDDVLFRRRESGVAC